MKSEIFMDAEDVANELGISKSQAYKVIREFNEELQAMGYWTTSGRINRKFFLKKVDYQEGA